MRHIFQNHQAEESEGASPLAKQRKDVRKREEELIKENKYFINMF